MVKVAVPVNPPKVSVLSKPSKLVELHAKEFSVDLKVQRQLNEDRADAMAAKFQPHALGLLTASKRADGHIYVLDGGHRCSAARKANYDGLIATRLFENLTLEEEAELFLTLNSSRAVQAIDRFKVRITMGEPSATAINKVLQTYGLHVDWANNQSLNTISAIGALEKVYHGAGVREEGNYTDLIDNVIRTLHKAYGEKNDRATYSRVMLEGLGIFIATFGKRIDYDRLVYVLQGTVPRQITVQTRAMKDAKVIAKGGTLGMSAAMVLHRLYNHRFRFKLPEFMEVEPRNDSYHEDRLKKDPLYVDPNQYVIDDALKEQADKEKASA
jgi:hypothetical protein